MKRCSLVFAGLLLAFVVGCDRIPYDKPEFQDVKPNETAFLVPLDGNTTDQSKMISKEFLEANKIATKRVQIPHKWVQDDRWASDGHYEPTHRLLTVNRSPVYREWTKDDKTGTSSTNQAIHVESSDSIGFYVGITCVGLVTEEDAAKFMYYHPAGGDVLATVMDGEVRSRIQTVFQNIAGTYTLNDVRDKKNTIMEGVRKDLDTFTKAYGVTITNVGITGGFEYENPEIQKSIDATAMAQQKKGQAEAALAAQSVENQRIAQEAEAKRTAAMTVSKGEIEAEQQKAQAELAIAQLKTNAEIENMGKLAQASEKLGPQLVAIRELEIRKATVEKWDGHLQPVLPGITTPFSYPSLTPTASK